MRSTRALNVGDSLCYSNSVNVAHQCIDDQLSLARPISLHAMWRACGEPTRKSPDQWVQLARNMIDGIKDYLKQTHMAFIDNPECPWRDAPIVDKPITARQYAKFAEHAPCPYYRIGDITADEEVAVLYAMFLDNHGQFECFVGGSPDPDDDDFDKPDLAVYSGDQ